MRQVLWLSAGLFLLGLATASAVSEYPGQREFVIHNWSAADGVPENSALAVAQTPDGYLWIGSSSGLLRFNAFEFDRFADTAGLKQLDTVVQSLNVDHSGRLWVSTSTGLAVLEKGKWRMIGGPVVSVRTIAESVGGEVFLGGFDGRLFRIVNDTVVPITNGPSLAPSGVFLIRDVRDDRVWLANRWFVGTKAGAEWKAVGPQHSPRGSLVAAPARGGGIWTYFEGQFWRYSADGSVTNWNGPVIDQPRELLEDSSGALWVASVSRGLYRWRPSGEVLILDAANGLRHNGARSIFQDAEGNFWAGTSANGLLRLKPRHLINVGQQDGLTDRIVKTITELSPGRMFVGTHGGGTAVIENDRVNWNAPAEKGSDAYAWSVLRDSEGHLWTGTFNSGLMVEERGIRKPFPLPQELGLSVGALLEEPKGRIFVGASSGLGLIENRVARVWPPSNVFEKMNVRSLLKDANEDALWVGTFGHGLWKVDLKTEQATRMEGLPRKRITSLAADRDGCVWVGVFGEGLFCVRRGHLVQIGRQQGLPANTIGAFLEDGRGYAWLGSDQGILRVSMESLHRVIQGLDVEAHFQVFDRADGMEIQECSEGLQPSAARDSAGRLWFATLRGVVRVNPGALRLNERPPPVVIEGFSYRDNTGTNHTGLAPSNGEFIFPAGSTSLEFHYAALTYTAPEKAKYAYRLEGADGNLVQAGKRRVAAFQILPPGRYRLRVIAANNDGLWNEQGATMAFAVQPFYWQTLWFRVLALGALAALVGSGVWRFARARYRHQITFLEQQRALAHERARLATVMEATTDLVAFADGRANLLHLNPAGRRMVGLENEAAHVGLTLRDLFAPSAAEQLTRECIPTAEQHGTWQGESVLMRRDGCEIPVSQVVMTHKGGEQVGFISIIARDISEQKRAAEEHEKLQTQLAQAQKMESVGRLAGGVAHEFNNMLQVIIGNADLALEEAPATSLLREELVGIRRSAERSAALTRQLLAFARRQTVVPRIIDLNAAVAEMLKMLHRLLGENIKVVWTPAPGLWPVQIDPAQVDQILANLTINARDAISGNGTVSLQTQNCALEAGSEQLPPDCAPGDYVVMTITDDGRGMPPEVQEHLFEPFFTTKAFGQGTGLGLATVFGIVKQNGGGIAVESRPDHGTTFRIFLPRAQEPAKTGEGQPEATKPQETGTVLLVEDEPQILELGRRALQKLGYTVLPASSPEMALELARQHAGPIDLLLTDLMMPGMNGKELRQQIQPARPGMKCLFMSGYTADIISQQGALAPDEAFIQKPFTLKELAEKLRTVLHP